MKKQLLLTILAAFAMSVQAEGKLLKVWNFESTKDVMIWPAGSTLELDDEEFHQGKKSLVFSPDNNCCIYFWQKVKAGNPYRATFWYKTDKTPIARCGMTINFKTADGKTITQKKALADVCEPDSQWHQATFDFTAPEGAVNAQILLDFYRCNSTVFIDEFKFFDESVQVEKAAIPTEPVSKGTLFKAVDFKDRTIYRDPKGTMQFGRDDAIGKDFLRITPEENYSAYFYLKPVPGKKYAVEFLYRAEGEVLKRCGFTWFFTSKGGKRGDCGQGHVPLNTLPDSNGNWRPGNFHFTVPENTDSCQFIVNFFRCNTNVDIADLKFYQE